MSFRITICCCDYLFGEGIKLLIELNGLNINTAISCSTPEDIAETKPDLVIADFSAFSNAFLDVSIERDVSFLLLGTDCLSKIENNCLLDFVSKGLVGILPYTADYSQLKKAIKSVTAGELWFERRKLQDLACSMESESVKKRLLLNKTEIKIVKMICQGNSNKEIRKKLKITEQSVKSHLSRIYKKTGVTDRLQLAVFAIKRNVPIEARHSF